MPLIPLLLLLLAVGVMLWLINAFIPMDPKINGILNAVVVIAVVLYLGQIFGLWDHLNLHNFKIGNLQLTSK